MRIPSIVAIVLAAAFAAQSHAQPAAGSAEEVPAAVAPPAAAGSGAPTAEPDGTTAAPQPQATGADPTAAVTPDDVFLPVRLLDRPPFDRITLNGDNQNAVIETVLLDLSDRRVPDPFPQTGSLELHQLSQPSIPYAVDWSAIAKIDLYENILLSEAKRLTTAGKFGEAFEYFAFLDANYPKLPGLAAALDDHLWRDASASFATGDGDAAWPALLALYDRNPKFPRLVNAVQAVSDSLIRAHLTAGDYAAARAALDVVERQFSNLELTNVAQWRQRLAADADAKLRAARAALAARDYNSARVAAMAAEAIAPELDEARTLLEQIQVAAPEFRVGVMQIGRITSFNETPNWAAARVAELVNPLLVRMVEFGAEGGVYKSRFGELASSDSGLQTSLRLSSNARRWGIAADAVALQLLKMAELDQATAREDLAAALVRLEVADGCEVRLQWRQPHLHAEALLQTPLRELTDAAHSPGLWFDAEVSGASADSVSYERTGPPSGSGGAPHIVVERVFDNDDAALAALATGEIDALDRVPPWQLSQASKMPGVEVEPYALPTVHVLVPNFDNPLLATREFRRALCYAVDCEGIVRDILLGGDEAAGFRALSGPFPAGVMMNDPVGYGYNSDLAPRPYEPRLAALLAGVARATLAKRDIEHRKARGEKVEEPDPTKEPTLPSPEPLILMHSSDPLARLACQALKLQLDRVGIPIKLVEQPAGTSNASSQDQPKYDLLYAEFAVWEPLTDARRLLGPHGVSGRSSALMTAALDELDRSQNWNEARARLRTIHRIAYYDLPLIPLWQTVNHYAHRNWLAGVGERPLTLYQNVDDWRKSFAANPRGDAP